MKPFDLVSRLEMQKTVTEVKTHSRIKKVVRWNIQKGTQTAMDSVLTYPFEDFQLSKIPLAQKVCLDSAGALARTDSIQGMTPAVLLYIKNTVSILSNDSRMAFWYLLPFALLFIVFSSLFYIRSIWAEVKDQK